jgi:hypothetical protein
MAQITVAKWRVGTTGPWFAFGDVTGGDDGLKDTIETVHGAGGEQGVYFGDVDCAPSVEVDVTNVTLGLLPHVLRASYPKGALTETLSIQLGTDTRGHEIQGCCLNELRLTWTFPGRLKARFGLLGLKPIQQAGGIVPAAVPATDQFFDQAGMAAVIAGSARGLRGFEWAITNGWKSVGDGDGRPAGAVHLRTAYERAIESPAFRTTVVLPVDHDLAADAKAHDYAATLTCANASASALKTLTLTAAGLGINAQPVALRAREDGDVLTDIDWHPLAGALSLAVS